MNPVHKLVYTLELPVRWGDLDALGHVNAAAYFVYFEQVRVEYLASIGQTVEFAEEGPVIINAQCTFLKQIFYPSTLLVKMYLAEPGRTSYMNYYEITTKANPDTIYASGSSKVVWVNYKKEKAIPLPDFIMTEFE